MTMFLCKTRDGGGAVVEKTIAAESQRDAIDKLKDMGLCPISISVANARKAGDGSATPEAGRRSVKVPARELLNFTTQMSGLMSAGVPIPTGIRAMRDQSSHDGFRDILTEVCADIEGGLSLSAALEKHPGAFPMAYVNSVAAGEKSGTLEQLLDNLAEFLEADMEVRGDVKQALMYPVILIGTLGLAISVLVIFVVPRFAKMYDGIGVELPLPTRILMGTSTAVTEHSLVVIAALVALVLGCAQVLKSKPGRAAFDKALLSVPVIGKLVRTAITLRVMQMLGLFNEVGLPMLDSLRTISHTISNTKIRKDLTTVASAVASGQTLSGGLTEAECFTPNVRQMIASGESMGSLSRCCGTVAKQLKKELNYQTKNLGTFIEPILTFGLAGIVLFVALATFLPMWDLASAMQK
jgi:type II secretory pathway component PulF